MRRAVQDGLALQADGNLPGGRAFIHVVPAETGRREIPGFQWPGVTKRFVCGVGITIRALTYLLEENSSESMKHNENA